MTVRLGLQANALQFTQLVALNVLVAALVGLERTSFRSSARTLRPQRALGGRDLVDAVRCAVRLEEVR